MIAHLAEVLAGHTRNGESATIIDTTTILYATRTICSAIDPELSSYGDGEYGQSTVKMCTPSNSRFLDQNK